MSKFDDFYNYALGNEFDTNGNMRNIGYVEWEDGSLLAGQCVSGIKAYLKYLGYTPRAYGNAIDYWKNRNSSGILNICDVVTGSPKNGDIGVSSGGSGFGHVFIYCNGAQFTQNCCGSPVFSVHELWHAGQVYGYLRPKAAQSSAQFKESDLIAELGRATLTVDRVNVRFDNPINGAVERVAHLGESFNYSHKWIGNGHRYIAWKESNRWRFLAISGSEQQGTDVWAKFDAQKKEPETLELIEEHGVCTLTVDGIRARLNSPTGEVVKTYSSGDSIRYSHKYIGSGHRYVVWDEGTNRIFLAISADESRTNMWATDFKSWEEDAEKITDSTTEEKGEEIPEEKPDIVPSSPPPEEEGMKDETMESSDLVKVQLVDSVYYRSKCPYLMEPVGVCVHNSGTPNASAQDLRDALNKPDTDPQALKSWHFSVDESGAVESLPLNRNAFHAGDGAHGVGNRQYIAIEICRDMEGDTDRAKKAEENAIALIVALLKRYDWDVDQVKKHQDFKMTDGTYKYCPHRILDNGWNEFVKRIEEKMKEKNEENKEEGKTEEMPEEKEEKKKRGRLLDLLVEFFERILGKH